MSVELNAFEAIALVPGWDPDAIDVEQLTGGLTNRTFLIHKEGVPYVLRLNAQHSDFVTLDRSCELRVLRHAAADDLGPQVIHADLDNGILITEYLKDRVWDKCDLNNVANIEALGALLQRVHQLPPSGIKLDIRLSASRYEKYLEKRQGLHTFATRCVEVIESIPTGEQVVCCHNDVVAENIIASDPLRLVDWEYACDNEPLFDLASVICYHNLDAQKSEVLLSAYAGGVAAELSERLADQLRLFDAIQWLWLASHHLNVPRHANVIRLEELQQRIR